MKKATKKKKDLKRTLVVSGFPGVGKSYYFEKETDKVVLDSDSSTFDKSDFPANYIRHIKENLGKVDVIMVSTHADVRKALVAEGIMFNLVYPDRTQKAIYMARYKMRGSTEQFIELIYNNWIQWLVELKLVGEQANHVILRQGQTLGDVLLGDAPAFVAYDEKPLPVS